MATATILHNHDEATAKVSREKLLAMTFGDFAALRGVPRAMAANAMVAKDVPIYARCDRDVLAKMVREQPKRFVRWKGRTAVTVALPLDNEDHLDVAIGPEWVRLRADQGVRLMILAGEDPLLGAPFSEMAAQDDGHGGKEWVPQQSQGYPGLLEFALTREVEGEKLIVAAA